MNIDPNSISSDDVLEMQDLFMAIKNMAAQKDIPAGMLLPAIAMMCAEMCVELTPMTHANFCEFLDLIKQQSKPLWKDKDMSKKHEKIDTF